MKTHIILLLLPLIFMACDTKNYPATVKLEGNTMGTTYHITYLDSAGIDYKHEVDSVLHAINQSMSTYIPTSIISTFNRDTANSLKVDDHFAEVMELAREVYEKTGGAFNPTVMPLVNAFGFGYENVEQVDSAMIDSLRQYVVFDSVWLIYVVNPLTMEEYAAVVKKKPGLKLDFSAIAKGYGVDVVGELLETKGIIHYMVEIGGEVRCRGKNAAGEFWRIGVEKPVEGAEQGDYGAIAHLDNVSMATSGNYRNFKVKDGKKYVHTINPKTGWPEMNNTLSVSVIAKDCATADAYATACMVLGKEKAAPIIDNLEGIDAYFIYTDSTGAIQTYATPGFKAVMEE